MVLRPSRAAGGTSSTANWILFSWSAQRASRCSTASSTELVEGGRPGAGDRHRLRRERATDPTAPPITTAVVGLHEITLCPMRLRS